MGKTFFKLCDEYNFEYIIRYKEDSASTIKKDFDKFYIADESYKYQNEIIYGEPDENKKYYTINVISYDEEIINEKNGEIITTNFSYITSLKIKNN